MADEIGKAVLTQDEDNDAKIKAATLTLFKVENYTRSLRNVLAGLNARAGHEPDLYAAEALAADLVEFLMAQRAILQADTAKAEPATKPSETLKKTTVVLH